MIGELDIMLWWISLGVSLVVTLIAALLLVWIINNAKIIHGAVSTIWDVGQRVANNTIHIPLLQRTNESVEKILGHAVNIIGHTEQIANSGSKKEA